MSCEALWSVSFKANNEHFGAGVIVLESLRALGGDMSFTYIGDYQVEGKRFKCNLRVKRFNNHNSPLYKDDYNISFEGDYDDSQFTITGSPDGDPAFVITVECTRVAELP